MYKNSATSLEIINLENCVLIIHFRETNISWLGLQIVSVAGRA